MTSSNAVKRWDYSNGKCCLSYSSGGKLRFMWQDTCWKLSSTEKKKSRAATTKEYAPLTSCRLDVPLSWKLYKGLFAEACGRLSFSHFSARNHMPVWCMCWQQLWLPESVFQSSSTQGPCPLRSWFIVEDSSSRTRGSQGVVAAHFPSWQCEMKHNGCEFSRESPGPRFPPKPMTLFLLTQCTFILIEIGFLSKLALSLSVGKAVWEEGRKTHTKTISLFNGQHLQQPDFREEEKKEEKNTTLLLNQAWKA